jgi:hypothetical protein
LCVSGFVVHNPAPGAGEQFEEKLPNRASWETSAKAQGSHGCPGRLGKDAMKRVDLVYGGGSSYMAAY